MSGKLGIVDRIFRRAGRYWPETALANACAQITPGGVVGAKSQLSVSMPLANARAGESAMTSRVFRPRSERTWWLEYVNAGGARRRVKTRIAHRPLAERLLSDVLADVQRQLRQTAAPEGGRGEK